jgi:hypothetical protein
MGWRCRVSDPIDGLIEWLNKAVEFHETQLETDEEIKTSNTLSVFYSGMLSGFQLARTQARQYKKLKETEQDSK